MDLSWTSYAAGPDTPPFNHTPPLQFNHTPPLQFNHTTPLQFNHTPQLNHTPPHHTPPLQLRTSHSTIPVIWKHTTITPFSKLGGPADLDTSFRPISLLCQTVMILERLLQSGTSSYSLYNNNNIKVYCKHQITSTNLVTKMTLLTYY